MQAVILAGGRGERLRPLTDMLPKPMVMVNGKPFLQHQLEFLRSLDFTDVLLLTGYLGEAISEHFGEGRSLGLRIRYSQEPQPLGTGGALQYAADFIHEKFLLLNGDTFLPMDYRHMETLSVRHGVLGVVAVCSNAGAMAANNIALDAAGRVVGYSKTDDRGMTHVDAGAILLGKQVLSLLPRTGKSSLEEQVYPQLIRQQTLMGCVCEESYYDIGTPERLERFRDYLCDHRQGAVSN